MAEQTALGDWGSNNPAHQCKPLDWKRNQKGGLPATHQHEDGGWWWYDETWVDEFGPYLTQAEADAGCQKYCDEYLNARKSAPTLALG